MNKIKEIEKKVKRNSIIYLFFLFVPTITCCVLGGVFSENNNLKALSISLFVLSGLFFVISTIWYGVSLVPLEKELRVINKNQTIEKINSVDGKNIFTSYDGKKMVFGKDGLSIDDSLAEYDETSAIFFFKIIKKAFNVSSILCVLIENETVSASIEVDGDLLNEMDENLVKKINYDDYQYFIKNYDECEKTIRRNTLMNPRTVDFILVFPKNEEEKKEFKKANRKKRIISIVSMTVFFVGIFSFEALSVFLNDTERGIEISERIGLSLIIQIVFSVFSISLAFVKAEKYPLSMKSLFIFFTISYWLGLLLFPFKFGLFIMNVFIILFLVIGVKYILQEEKKNHDDKGNRFVFFGAFLSLIFIFQISDIGLQESSFEKILLITGLTCAFIAISVFIYMFVNFKKNKEQGENKKKQIALLVSLPIIILFLGTCFLAFEIEALNFMFDFDKGTTFTCEIVELEEEEEYSSPKANVVIEGKEISVSLSQKEYFNLEVGDSIIITKYKGLFGMNYFIKKVDE